MSQKYTNNITATTTPTTIPLESPHHYPHTQGLSLKNINDRKLQNLQV